MTTLETCVCSHMVGDHKSARTSFPHPPRYGVCLVPGCDCRAFTPTGVDPDFEGWLVRVAPGEDTP